MTTIIIYTVKGRDITMFDITDTYLHTDIPTENRVVVKIRVESINILC